MKRVVDRIPESFWLLAIPAAIFLAGYLLIVGVCVL